MVREETGPRCKHLRRYPYTNYQADCTHTAAPFKRIVLEQIYRHHKYEILNKKSARKPPKNGVFLEGGGVPVFCLTCWER